MKNQFKTIEQVWNALDQNKTIYWSSDAYALTIESSRLDWRKERGLNIPISNRDGKCIRVTCTANYFGSLLEPSELIHLYTK